MAAPMAVRYSARLASFSRYFPLQFSFSQKLRFLSTEPNEAQNTDEKSDPKTGESPKQEQPSEIEVQLTEEKKKLEETVLDLKDKYQRALAEAENVRKRFQKQLDDSKLYSIQGFCKDLLEVADILGTATGSVPKGELEGSNVNPHLKSLYEGLVMTEIQLQKVFNKNQLFKIDPQDEKFDPNFHEALFEIPAPDKKPGDVAVVTKIGYRLHNRTLRPALVGVAKAAS